jgi:hypothetical protein
VNNARHEGLNRRVRLIVNRAYGFHSSKAALALINLTLALSSTSYRMNECTPFLELDPHLAWRPDQS